LSKLVSAEGGVVLKTAEAGDWVQSQGSARVKVKEACAALDGGSWVCVTHRAGFGSQRGKDEHIAEAGEHTLVWKCDEHGYEEP
jgi:hypothetical protein